MLLQSLDLVDRLLSKFKDQGILQMISLTIQQMIERGQHDSKFMMLSLLLASQIGEYINDCAELSPLIPIIVDNCSHASASLRFAAYHCLGQLSIDQGPKFQVLYGERVLPCLIVGASDKVYFVN